MKIPLADLKSALALLSPIATRRSAQPILNNILVHIGEEITLSAFNSEEWCSIRLKKPPKTPVGAFCVPASHFVAAIHNGCAVEAVIAWDEHSMRIECGVVTTIKPLLSGVEYGVADWVDRIEAIGNGQVPRVVATAWRALTL